MGDREENSERQKKRSYHEALGNRQSLCSVSASTDSKAEVFDEELITIQPQAKKHKVDEGLASDSDAETENQPQM